MTLERVLKKLWVKLGAGPLADILNLECGKNRLGTIEFALKSNMSLVPLLKWYGAVEQGPAPDDWVAKRRRGESQAGDNWGGEWWWSGGGSERSHVVPQAGWSLLR